MTLLDGAYHSELSCELRETLLFCSLCKAFVHVCPLEILAVGSCCEVSCSIADSLEFLEPHLSVFLLVISCLEEDRSDLLEAFLLSLRCEISILIPSLGLACKSGLEILLCLCTSVFVSHN